MTRLAFTRFLSLAVAVALMAGYVSPSVCAALRGDPLPQSSHCPEPETGTNGAPQVPGAPLVAAGHVVPCPDAAHCVTGFAGAAPRVLMIELDPPAAGVTSSGDAAVSRRLTGPPAPPPKR